GNSKRKKKMRAKVKRRTQVINIRELSAGDRIKVMRGTLKGHVYIGRSVSGTLGQWGNAWTHLNSRIPGTQKVSSRDAAVKIHRRHTKLNSELCSRIRRDLKGKILVCWCKPQACHGDTLAEIAES